MLEMFKKFIVDEDYEEMFVTGPAGSGKTTGLAKAVEYCIENDISYIVCAFTHQACGILRSKLPADAKIATTHKFIRKRPTVNQDALKEKHVQISAKFGEANKYTVAFIDEYSNVGERDIMDLRALEIKIVWIGDSNQLPPVGDVFTLRPNGPYCLKLTKIHRQANDNPLLDTLTQLVSFIEDKAEPTTLITSSNFIREQDIVEWYDNDRTCQDLEFNGVLLAFTNKRVEELNAQAEGKTEPVKGDRLFSPTTKEYYVFLEYIDYTNLLDVPFGAPLQLGSKYKTLEQLHDLSYIKFAKVIDEEDNELVLATMFGHGKYNDKLIELKKEAAASNAAIGKDAKAWVANNQGSPKARRRAKAWREFLAFNQAVICLDFSHAMTVHKSQGSTFSTVYLDTEDLAIARNISYTLYLKLLYVGISRASKYVITN